MKMLPEERINKQIKGFDGTIGIAVKLLYDGASFFHKADEIFHAASIIKIPILVELFRQVDERIVSLDERIILKDEYKVGGAGILHELHQGIVLTVRDLVVLMIVLSDNTASNILMDLVKMDNVNRLMFDIGMKRSSLNKKFMIILEDSSIRNEMTPNDTLLILEKLYKGEILSKESTYEALDILMRQQYRDKIPLYLPEDLKIANKTGEVTGVRHDAAIVFLENYPFILCIFTKDCKNHLIADKTIATISKDIFLELSGQSSL